MPSPLLCLRWPSCIKYWKPYFSTNSPDSTTTMSSSKQIIETSHAPAPIGPYNQAVKAGNALYVSGQIPIDPATGDLVSGSLEDEAHQVLKNVGAVLEAAGYGFGDVVKTSIFLRSMDDFA